MGASVDLTAWKRHGPRVMGSVAAEAVGEEGHGAGESRHRREVAEVAAAQTAPNDAFQ